MGVWRDEGGRLAVGGSVAPRWCVALLVVVSGTAVGSAAPAGVGAQPLEPCSAPDALFAAGQLTDALVLYEGVLQDQPGEPCAVARVEEIGERQAAAAASIVEAHTAARLDRPTDVIDAVVEALEQDPSSGEARDLLAGIGMSSAPDAGGDAFAKARLLLAAGFVADAQAEARRVITAGESSDPVPPELRVDGRDDPFDEARLLLAAGFASDAQAEARRVVTSGEAPGPIPAELRARSADQATAFAEAEALLVAGYQTEARAAARTALAADPNLELPDAFERTWWEKFTDWVQRWAVPGGLAVLVSLWLFRRLRRARVVVDGKLVADDSESVVGMLIAEVATGSTGTSLERVDDAAKAPAFELGGLFPSQWSWIAQLLRLVAGRPVVRVHPELRTAGDKSVTITVTIHRSGRKLVSSPPFEVRRAGRDEAEVVAEVVAMAGAWTSFRLGTAAKAWLGRPITVPGAANWRSWGAFRQGVVVVGQGHRDLARRRFLEALAHDPDNVYALTNLGQLDVRAPAALPVALRRLARADQLLSDTDATKRSLLFRVLYLRAAAALHCAGVTEPLDWGDGEALTADQCLTSARDSAVRLVRLMAQMHSELLDGNGRDRRPWGPRDVAVDDDLRNVVRATETTAIALLRSIQIARGVQDESPAHPDTATKAITYLRNVPDDAHPATLMACLTVLAGVVAFEAGTFYNLACNAARQYTDPGADHPVLLHQMAINLRAAVERDPRVASELDGDHAFAAVRTGSHAESFAVLVASLQPAPATPSPPSWQRVQVALTPWFPGTPAPT